MRSNWEIHGGVPCRAWQAAGIGMGEGRGRHSMEQHSLHGNTALQPAPSSGLLSCTCNGVSCPLETCITDHRAGQLGTHTPCVWPRRALPGARRALSLPLLRQLKADFTSSSPKGEPSLTWAPRHPGEEETISFIGVSVSFRPCLLEKPIGTSVPHQISAVLLGLEVCSSV